MRRRTIVLSIAAVPLFLAAGLETHVRLAWKASEDANRAAAAKTCSKAVSPEWAVRNSSAVFEGILVDKSTFIGAGFPRMDDYTFQVVRSWGPPAEPDAQSPPKPPRAAAEIHLSHLFIGGYAYHSFDLGRRYLVFAVLHDMPPQLFAHACSPVAEGADIPAIAARLGPPRAIYDEKNAAPPRPFWMPAARALRLRMSAALVTVARIHSKLTGREL